MFGLPTTWLIGGVAACAALFLTHVHIKTNARVESARHEGIAIGTGKTATATLEAATKTAAAERAAEAETPLPPDKAAIIALCRKSASCRERSTLK